MVTFAIVKTTQDQVSIIAKELNGLDIEKVNDTTFHITVFDRNEKILVDYLDHNDIEYFKAKWDS